MCNPFRLLFLFAAALFLGACATESAPLGGKEDDTPPAARKFSPENKSVNFTSGRVEIVFDENIQAGGFSSVLSSPNIEPKPDIYAYAKKLTIKFKEPLRENTTYTINFGNEIKDLNQGNVLDNFTYVFSTGSYIDSQAIKGKVYLAKDGSAADNVLVLLYRDEMANAVTRRKPDYFARTNKSGEYKIENVKAAHYQIYALQDKNLNYQYDGPGEAVGFLENEISLFDTVVQTQDLHLFQELAAIPELQNVKSIQPGKFSFRLNRPVDTLLFTGKAVDGGYHVAFTPEKDSAVVSYSNYYINKDTLLADFGNSIFDTLSMEYRNISPDSASRYAGFFLLFQNQLITKAIKADLGAREEQQELFKPLKINLAHPIREINNSKKAVLSLDSLRGTEVPCVIAPFGDINDKLELNFSRQAGKRYVLQVPDSMCRNLYGFWNKAATYTFWIREKNKYGNIKIKYNLFDSQQPRLLVLERSGGTQPEIIPLSASEMLLKDREAGEYKIRIIEDRNGNGKWDTGSLERKQQPEKVISYPNRYELKGGWDLDIEIK